MSSYFWSKIYLSLYFSPLRWKYDPLKKKKKMLQTHFYAQNWIVRVYISLETSF